jgi:hypothetical protein
MATAWLLTVTVIGQTTPTSRPQLAEEVFTNIQILRGMPVDQFMGTMGFFSASLGLNCTDCHVDESGGSWARYADDNALKRMSRVMLQMVSTINKTSFGGRQVVTCFTCHRGNRRPAVMPSLDLLYSSPGADEPGDPIQQAAGQPAADTILDRYLQAVGGTQRLAGLTSLAGTGLFLGFDDADKLPVDLFVNAQGQRATVIHTLLGDSTTTFDGREGWVAAPASDKPVPLLAMTGQELDGARLEALAFFPAGIKQALTNWRSGYPTTIGDRDVNVLQGTMPGGGTATLCFDVETGLLTRLVRWSTSPVGRIVTRVDYSDYRDAAGVKVPHRWTVTWLNGRSHYELTRVQPNVAIPATRFAKPAPSTPPRR